MLTAVWVVWVCTLSAVEAFVCDNVTQHAGFINVNATQNRNLFYWFFEARAEPMEKPVVLWLQGGPGARSVVGGGLSHARVIDDDL